MTKPVKSPRASRASQAAILLISFTLNFNEALLIAEISQTFFKFMGITILSSTIIWFVPMVVYILVSPLFNQLVLYYHPKVHMTVLLSLVVLLFCNTLAFSYLHYLETIAAGHLTDHHFYMLAGIAAFSTIDLAKMIFDFSLFEFVSQRVARKHRGGFETAQMYGTVVSRILGGLVSCLYVLQQKTFSGRFSEYFYTNIQLCYFLAGVLNALTMAVAFVCWPKEEVQPGQLQFPHHGESYLAHSFPGLRTFAQLTKANQLLGLRKFFIIGLYFNVVLTITQWISNLFTARYSKSFLNDSMQVLDIGTSWGSISLTVYFCLFGIQTILSRVYGGRVVKYAKYVSMASAGLGGGALVATYLLYDQDIKIILILLGLSGVGHNVFLDHRITEEFERDPALAGCRGFERRKKVEELDILVEIMAYIVFVFLFPVLFFSVDDKYWILASGVIYLGLMAWNPRLSAGG